MTKLLKIFFRMIGGILEWTLVLLIFLVFAIRSYKFQTYLGQQATAYLSSELNTKISVEKVFIIFFDKVALDGVIVLDQKQDTIASLGSVFVTLKRYNGLTNHLDLKELNLKKGNIKLSKNKTNGEFNFQFISDYFASTDTTKSEPMEIDLRKIKLTQINFKYDDYRKSYASFGMDYDHLNFKNIYLTATLNLNKKGGISANVKHISLREKCGFELDRFSSKIIFNKKGLQLKYLNIYTPKSKIYFSKLNLKTKNSDDFTEFVDKVVFDIDLKPSLISLSDISCFATALEGMDDKIIMSGLITKRIKDLRIEDLDFKTGDRTRLLGTFNLPDFRTFDKSFFDEKLQYAYLDFKDLEAIKLPKSSKERHLSLGDMVHKLGFVELKDLKLDGNYSQFVLKSDQIKTKLGSIEMDNGIMFTEHKDRNSFTFEKPIVAEYDLKIDSFLLGQFIDNSNIGGLSGQFSLNGEIFSGGKIDFNSINGSLKSIDFQDYVYKNIEIKEASFKNNVFVGKVAIDDNNLNLSYDGLLDFNTNQRFKFSIDINDAELDKLNLTTQDRTVLKSMFFVDISGTNLNNYSGGVQLEGLEYGEGDKKFIVPSMSIKMDRSIERDKLSIDSDIARASIEGKVDFASISDAIQNQFNKILPAIFTVKKVKKHQQKNQFLYNLEAKNLNEMLAIFAPGLNIASGTSINGNFDEGKNEFLMNLKSQQIAYNDIVLKELEVNQNLTDSLLIADYSVKQLNVNDSLKINNASFHAKGNKGEIDSELKWNPQTENESYFSWKTIINDINSYFFNVNPSYFTIRNHHWNIVNNSQIRLAPNDIEIQNFKMQRENQFLTIDGAISKSMEDILRVQITDLELSDFTSLIGLPVNIRGNLNGLATISNPFTDIAFSSDAKIRDLHIDNQEVGDINMNGSWQSDSKSIDLNGELYYRKSKTFDFRGHYFTERLKNSLDFDLDFEYTDLNFTNVFMDPQVVSGIRGLLNGKMKVTGTPESPQIEGLVSLLGGNAKVEMFGVNFGFNGDISMDKDGIYIDNMPVMDEDGNMGSLVGTVFHRNFQDWNFDLDFNLEDDAFALSQGQAGQPLDRFLLLNTAYKEGDMYYGKAYATGRANIYGYAENLQIDVNMETQSETVINFPMYGTSDIQEDKFLIFNELPDSLQHKKKIDLTGIEMNLNFEVTPKAKLRVIFNENLGDVITAYGRGDISIGVDNVGDVTMDGVFEIENPVSDKSVYNFVMGPIKQPFYISEGGTIGWTGDPIDAKLNLQTFTPVQTSLAEIMPNLDNSNSKVIKEVRCNLDLTQSLNDPLITFDINVMQATENDRAAINRIKGDKDELNKQFFSLLLVKKFQPLQGQLSAGSGAALDLVSSQLNDILGSLSQDVKFGVDLKNGANGGGKKSLTTSKSFNDGRLIIKTSLGVESPSDNGGSSGQSSFIGDVNVEYLINEEGTFRVSIFNQSNDNTVIQEKNLGQFTQGAGLNYQEDFNNFQDFKMAQYFLDLFRKKGAKRYPIKKKRKQSEVPKAPVDPMIKPENP